MFQGTPYRVHSSAYCSSPAALCHPVTPSPRHLVTGPPLTRFPQICYSERNGLIPTPPFPREDPTHGFRSLLPLSLWQRQEIQVVLPAHSQPNREGVPSRRGWSTRGGPADHG